LPDSQNLGAAGSETPVRIDVFGATHCGKVRPVNEDQFFIASLHKSMRVHQTSLDDLGAFARLSGSTAYLLVVADGLGGHRDGQLASGTAVTTIAAHLGETIGCCYSFDVDEEHAFLSQLEDAVARAHRQVLQRHAGDGGPGPATTLTMVALMWPRAYVVHVGDSRAYYLRGGRLRQLTRDQTVYDQLLDAGVAQEGPPGSPGIEDRMKNVLTSAIGFEITPSIGLVDLEPGDALLLCTDGLVKHVPDADIAGILGECGSAEDGCRRLVDVTLERGARDNVTAIVGRFAAS
jgi:protein phosphatase